MSIFSCVCLGSSLYSLIILWSLLSIAILDFTILITKITSFCTTKGTISKVKRQPSEWERIIANAETDKQPVSKIYKQLLQLNSRKINDPIKKWAKELNRHFSKKTYRWLTNT